MAVRLHYVIANVGTIGLATADIKYLEVIELCSFLREKIRVIVYVLTIGLCIYKNLNAKAFVYALTLGLCTYMTVNAEALVYVLAIGLGSRVHWHRMLRC